jgi:hypothetical protein
MPQVLARYGLAEPAADCQDSTARRGRETIGQFDVLA